MRIRANDISDWNLYLDKEAIDPNPTLKGTKIKGKYALCILSGKTLKDKFGVSTFLFLYSTSQTYIDDKNYCIPIEPTSFINYTSDKGLQIRIDLFSKKICHFDARRLYKALYPKIQSKADRGVFLYFAELNNELLAKEILGKLSNNKPLDGYAEYQMMTEIEEEEIKNSIKSKFGI